MARLLRTSRSSSPRLAARPTTDLGPGLSSSATYHSPPTRKATQDNQMEKFELTLADDTPGIGRAGERVQLALTPADVHLPEELSTYMAGYHVPGGFRADEASKII